MMLLPIRLKLSFPARPAIGPRLRRRTGRRAVFAFLFAALAVNVGFAICMERVEPSIRDPEYGYRLSRLKTQRRTHTDRPFAVVLGSSRTAMGVRPTAANTDAGPMTFNMGQVGAGPVMQLMTLRRLLASGVSPEAVLVEFWPAFLRGDGIYCEEGRIDKRRLLPIDEPFIRDYFLQPDDTLAIMNRLRWNPVFEYRGRVMNQIDHRWLHRSQHFENTFDRMDPWGWLPGQSKPFDGEFQARIRIGTWNYYGPLFANYSIAPAAERATRELLAICRERGIRTAFVWLPESKLFTDGYPPAVIADAERFLARVRAEYAVPLIDARTWADDAQLFDGFHLSQAGAATFSAKLGDAVRTMFPTLPRRQP